MTISSVAPAVITGAVAGASGDPAGLFAGILGAAPADGEPAIAALLELGSSGAGQREVVEPGVELDPFADLPSPLAEEVAPAVAVGIVEILGAAQLMAAAQVVPISPVLPAALAATAGSSAPVAAPATAPTSADLPVATPQSASDAPEPVAQPSSQAGAAPMGAPDTGTTGSTGLTGPTGPTEATGVEATPVTAGPATASSPGEGRPDHGSGRRQAEHAEPVNAVNGAPQTAPSQAVQPVAAAAARQDVTPAGQVTGQVFPEVARLVSRGDGTQRITLKLTPEALGDVRVVLTVRDGDVHVRMVGSEQAQQALRAGAPELHRLLDLAGAGSSQIVVGDHSSSTDAGLPGGTGDRHTAHHSQDHRTAGTRDGDTPARDGYPGESQPRPPTDPTATRGGVTGTPAGVDVTI